MTQKILSRFRMWSRIAFLLITIFIPLSVLGVFSLLGIESYIDFAEREKIGASMMRSMNVLFSPVAHISSDKRNVSADDKLRAEALQSIELLGDIWEKNKVYLNLSSEEGTPNELRRKFEAPWAKSSTDSQESAKNFLEYSLKMIKEIGNRTNLILDPDLDSYYMINTIVNQVPEIHQALMRWQWLRESNASKEEQAKYEGLISIHLIPNVYSNLRNVQQEDKNLYEEDAGLHLDTIRKESDERSALCQLLLVSESWVLRESETLEEGRKYLKEVRSIDSSHKEGIV